MVISKCAATIAQSVYSFDILKSIPPAVPCYLCFLIQKSYQKGLYNLTRDFIN